MRIYRLEVSEQIFKRVSVKAKSRKDAIRKFREGTASILDENVVDVEQDIK